MTLHKATDSSGDLQSAIDITQAQSAMHKVTDASGIDLHSVIGISQAHVTEHKVDLQFTVAGSQAKLTVRKDSHIRFLSSHRELAACSFTSFALFLPISSFLRRQAQVVDTLGFSALLRYGIFLQARHGSVSLRELYHVFSLV